MIENSEFEIVSPARLQSVDVNWLQCFICQTNTGEDLVNPTEKKGKQSRISPPLRHAFEPLEEVHRIGLNRLNFISSL